MSSFFLGQVRESLLLLAEMGVEHRSPGRDADLRVVDGAQMQN